MKKFISGFLVGAMIFGAIGAFAASYVANPVSFKVMVNGSEFVSDPPALEVEGRTYLPLRAMGEALGVPVNWNEELRQAEVGNMATVANQGEYSRNNPAPINTVQIFDRVYEHLEEYNYSVAVRVLECVRGNEAVDLLKKENYYVPTPEEGYEFAVAKIAFSVLSTYNNKSMSVSYVNFTSVSSNNEKLPYASPTAPSPRLSAQLSPGESTEGYAVFLVKKDDANSKIVYGLDSDGTGGIWFSLN